MNEREAEIYRIGTVPCPPYTGQIIKFRFLDGPVSDLRFIAFSEDNLRAKLGGRMAEVEMPARPLLVRLWRKLFPPRAIEVPPGQTATLAG
jgi:hypothetical protein